MLNDLQENDIEFQKKIYTGDSAKAAKYIQRPRESAVSTKSTSSIVVSHISDAHLTNDETVMIIFEPDNIRCTREHLFEDVQVDGSTLTSYNMNEVHIIIFIIPSCEKISFI